MDYSIWQLIIFFFCYSIIGWFLLTGIRSIQNRRLVNVGVLNGPVCPGLGVMLTICVWLVQDARGKYWWQYMLCVAVALAVLSLEERISKKTVGRSQHDILIRMFHGFGKYSIVLCYLTLGMVGFCFSNLLHPFLLILVNLIPRMILFVMDLVLMGIFVIDMITSGLFLRKLHNDNNRLQKNVTRSLDDARINWGRVFVRMLYRRIERAYPELSADEKHAEQRPVFASGMGFTKLFWVFLICALAGDLIETVYCGTVDGRWMSRSSFLYGSLSIVWGGGAALGIAILEPLAKKNDRWVFMGGFFIGGAYEYLCSVFTEAVFGQVFWDYSGFPLNINGRTNVLFMFFWGIAALVLVKFLYPKMSNLIEKISPLRGLVLTWILTGILILDLLVTGLALGRYALRKKYTQTNNQVFHYLDTHYPDELIEKRWQNMKPGEYKRSKNSTQMAARK